jgi:hypothetical protein
MMGFEIAFQLGMLHGYAIHAAFQLEERKAEKKALLNADDTLILDYIKSKSIVYMEDIIGYAGWSDDRALRISVGHAMTKLGWLRRRATDKRWYYTRGPKAVAYVEPVS